jgi:uncharacterized protein (DUF58 family)
MNPSVAQYIKNLELATKRLMKVNLLGNARSVTKGSGLEFNQLRDYQIGDDVRAIDWNSSARMNKLLIKEFTDERYKTVILAIDCSSSCWYGSGNALKQEIQLQIAALIGYAAYLGKDEVGLVLFANSIQLYIPPAKGKTHIQNILEKIFTLRATPAGTDINGALEYIASLRKKNAMVIMISDFIDEHSFEKKITFVARMYDLIVVRVIDPYEMHFPSLGLITVKDSETGQETVIDARRSTAKKFQAVLQERLDEQKKLFAKNRIDCLHVATNDQLVDQLIYFFKARLI